MTSFWDSLAVLARFPDTAMALPWAWRDTGEVLEVRDAFHRTLEAEYEQAALVQAAGRLTEPAVAMVAADRALGDLLGLLAGQPDDILDVEPLAGEWALRKVLHHALEVELSFACNTRWAVERADTDSLRPSDELRERESTAPAEGSVDEIMRRLIAARTATTRFAATLQPAQLTRPTIWASHDVDVRFRLHRFASHLTEHTIQVEKVLHALNRDPAEARQMVRAIWSARAAHERHSAMEDVARLDHALAERAAQVTARVAG